MSREEWTAQGEPRARQERVDNWCEDYEKKKEQQQGEEEYNRKQAAKAAAEEKERTEEQAKARARAVLEAAAGEDEGQRKEKLRKVNEENRLKAQNTRAQEEGMNYPYDSSEWVEFIEDGHVYDFNKLTKERIWRGKEATYKFQKVPGKFDTGKKRGEYEGDATTAGSADPAGSEEEGAPPEDEAAAETSGQQQP